MPRVNYRTVQDSEIRNTSESESEEERVDMRTVEHHKKRRAYRSRSQSTEFPERRRSLSEERSRGIQHGARRERSGYRPRNEPPYKAPKVKLPQYQGWSTERPASKRKCKEHSVYQNPDSEKMMEKKEKKIVTGRPGNSTAPVPATLVAQPGQTTTAQRAATQPPSLSTQPSSAAQITGMQVDQDFFFKTLQHIERIVTASKQAGQSKRDIKHEPIEVDLTRIKEEKPELVTIQDHGDEDEDKETKAEADLEQTEQSVIEDQNMEIEKPTNTKKRIKNMIKIIKTDDLKETK